MMKIEGFVANPQAVLGFLPLVCYVTWVGLPNVAILGCRCLAVLEVLEACPNSAHNCQRFCCSAVKTYNYFLQQLILVVVQRRHCPVYSQFSFKIMFGELSFYLSQNTEHITCVIIVYHSRRRFGR
jgi:hypothetical protein